MITPTLKKVFVTGGSRLPSAYQEVEYLESSGTQYIQLNFGFDNTDEIGFKFSEKYEGQTSDKYMIAPQTWNNNNNRFAFGRHLSFYTCAYGAGSTSSTKLLPQTSYEDELPHTWHYKNNVFSVDNPALSLDVSSIVWGGTTTNLKLFYGYNSNTKGAIYYYHHKKANAEYNLIPCYRKSDSVAGMYNLAFENIVNVESGSSQYTRSIYTFTSAEIEAMRGKTWTASVNFSNIQYSSEVASACSVYAYVNGTATAGKFVNTSGGLSSVSFAVDENTTSLSISVIRGAQSITSFDYSDVAVGIGLAFYTNEGTGEFIVGEDTSSIIITPCYKSVYVYRGARLPSAYQEVEYLRTSGNTWFNTGVYLSGDNWEVETKYNMDYASKVSNALFGAQTGTPLLALHAQGMYCYGGSGTATNRIKNGVFKANQITEVKIQVNNGTVTLDVDGAINSYEAVTNFTDGALASNYPVYLGTNNNNGAFNQYYVGDIYRWKISHNGTVLRNLVPCYRKSDSVAGMYNLAFNSLWSVEDGSSTATKVFHTFTTEELASFMGKTITVGAYFKNIITTETAGNTMAVAMRKNGVVTVGNWVGVDGGCSILSVTIDSSITSLTLQAMRSGAQVTRYDYYDVSISENGLPFYTNSGTGTFIVGPDINALTTVTTIQSRFVH